MGFIKLTLLSSFSLLALSGAAHAIDLSKAPSAAELSKMSSVDVCRHFELRETAAIKAEISSQGLKCEPILKNWTVLQNKKSTEDDRQKQQQARERAQEQDRLAKAAEAKRLEEDAKRQTEARANAQRELDKRLAEERRLQQEYLSKLAEIEATKAKIAADESRQRRFNDGIANMQRGLGMLTPPPVQSPFPPVQAPLNCFSVATGNTTSTQCR